MIVYLNQDESDPVVITVTRRVEGDGIIGDSQFEIRKEDGGSFLGRSYEEMLAMGNGRLDMVEK